MSGGPGDERVGGDSGRPWGAVPVAASYQSNVRETSERKA
jgi:hypothetical protein